MNKSGNKYYTVPLWAAQLIGVLLVVHAVFDLWVAYR